MDRELELLEQLIDVTEIALNRMASAYSTMDFKAGRPLHLKEIHTVQSIGREPGITVTALAHKMQVTKGAISQTVAKLIKKGLVIKRLDAANVREKPLELTPLGTIAFENHEKFHLELMSMLREHLGQNRVVKIELLTDIMLHIMEIMDKFK